MILYKSLLDDVNSPNQTISFRFSPLFKTLILLLAVCLPNHQISAHGDLSAAIQQLNHQIEQAPEDAQLYFKRALFYKVQGELDLALVDLHQTLMMDPQLEASHLQLALVYLEQNLWKFSIQHINNFIDKAPDNPFGYQTRAAIFQKSGDHASAISDLRETLRLKNDSAIRPDDYLILAEAILTANPQNYTEARQVIEAGMDRLGRLISLQNYLLDLLLEQGNCAAALQLVDQIMEPFARKDKWLLKKAEILEMDGQRHQATKLRKTAVGVNNQPSLKAPQALTNANRFTLNRARAKAPFALQTQVVRGPYLQSNTTNSIIIKWRTDIPTDSKVWYGTDASNLNEVVAQPQNLTDHELYISGLSAGTTYYYAVGNNEGILAGNTNEHYFKTSPQPGSSQPVRAWILGDSGTKNNNARAVRDGYLSYAGSQQTDLILMLGDNAYPDGEDDEYQEAVFENMYENSLIHTPLWSAPGNHDYYSASAATQTGPYFDIFSFPKNGEAGGLPSGTEAYYSFDYSNIHFVSLDSHDSGRSPGDPMLIWLENDLAATDKDWIIVFFHHPPYSKGSHDSDDETKLREMRENVLPILEAAGVDLVLSGHSHSYERSYLMHQHYGHSSTLLPSMILDGGDGRTDGNGAYQKSTTGPTAGDGAVYTVAGASGKVSSASSAPLDHPAMFFNALSLGSLSLEVDGLNLDLKYIDEQGSVLDYFSIQKDPPNGFSPSVSLVSPNDGTFFFSQQTISLEADATDQDGSIQQVEFFVNDVSVGIDDNAPYALNWTIPATGNFSIKAKALDNDGNEDISTSITITSLVPNTSSCAKILDKKDDAEQGQSGVVNLTSSDLELGEERGNGQTVGLLFTGLNIPQGAQIATAYLQFTVDETTNINPCELNIYGEDTDDANGFSPINHNISNRPYTDESITWSPPDWTNVAEAGPAQRTPNLAAIIQEIVNREGYTSASAIAIIIEGVGRRTAEAFDGNAAKAAELCVEYGSISYDCPSIQADIGSPCDDGDPCTTGDVVQADCSCAGTIQDSDNDGVCDANDLCNGGPEPGTSCDDGDPSTFGETIQADCSCGGGNTSLSVCSIISSGSDDAEEDDAGRISLSSSDLELGHEVNTEQLVGLRFVDLNIPQGAQIVSAHLQFAVDQTNNLDPCVLILYGQADDDPETFTNTIDNISDRPFTGASVLWSPPEWTNMGDQGDAQQSADISTILQEIVNRPGFSSNSAIVIIIDGSGRRTAEAFDGTSALAPELCVTYTQFGPTFDCENLQANFGDPCDDGNPCTTGDVVQADCSCAGTLVDTDNDGVCDANDICNGGPEPGTPCDDGDLCTTGDVIQADCSCAGTMVDTDNDGTCDANDICNSGPEPGTPCDDGDPNTAGETVQPDCSCSDGQSAVTSCSSIGSSTDDAEQDPSGDVYLTSSDLELVNDGSDQTIGLRFVDLNIPQGANIISAQIQFTVDKTNNTNPCQLSIYGEASDDANTFTNDNNDISNRPHTANSATWSPPDWQSIGESGLDQQSVDISSILQEIVNRSGFNSSSSVAIIIDGSGRRTATSFNGNAAAAPELCVTYEVVSEDCPSLQADIGDPCDDGDPCTSGDIVQADCSCAGVYQDTDNDGVCDANDLCNGGPEPGTSCDDGDPCTTGDVIQADCSCAGTFADTDNDGICDANDLCNGGPEPGTSCDDGDPCTTGDVIQADCSCAGTFADTDNDGICDANDLCNGGPEPGTSCDDGDPCTTGDVIQADCSCAGTFADTDNDGVCDANDICNGGPEPGTSCDDGDPCTTGDVIQADCSCAGTIVDSDNDGVCDANDLCNGGPEPGTSCDDGDPSTFGETIQEDCSCGGGSALVPTCSTILSGSDDAEEDEAGRMSIASSDLELGEEIDTDQIVGLRFVDLNIPQGAEIVSAHVQFAVDQTNNLTPCVLNLYGQADDDPEAFANTIGNISNRPTTNASVLWSPPEWTNTGNQGNAQLSPDISTVLQEIVNRSGFSSNSAIVLMIDGGGRRTAEAFNGTSAMAPELCVTYSVAGPTFDCENLQANFGDPCNDGDDCTTGDVIQADCSCAGTLVDTDNDGTCDANDICNGGPEPGTSCDDGDPCTTGDVIQADCSCAGTMVDSDNDGVCDANDICNGGPEPGTSCDDGDDCTIGDVIQADCSCAGTMVDSDNDGVCDANDICNGGPEPGTSCDDGDDCTTGDVIQADCSCAGTIVDSDNDGVCDANDICNGGPEPGTSCDDGDDCTTGDVIQADCSCAGTMVDSDNDGVCDANDICNGGPEPGTPCDDGDPCTTGDVIQADCSCAGTLVDTDNDGTCDANDICNGGPEPGTPCDDGDPCTTGDVIQADCSCAGTLVDTDNDGTCDANDICNGGPEPGTACDDGDPNTAGETVQPDCSCGGGQSAVTSCSSIGSSTDDAEQDPSGDMYLTSSDLELVNDGSNQTIGLRFVDLNIPQGANIISAQIQFTVDKTNNANPCQLSIYGEASDDANTFTNDNNDISNRPHTASSATWSPPDWQSIGESGLDQQSVDISSILQEIVNRSGFNSSSAVAVIIDGSGRRTATSFNGKASEAPELCVTYEVVPSDCPNLQADIGDPCDDGDPCTSGDIVQADCSCAGVYQDTDNDGVCDANDLCNGGPEPGTSCDDGDPCTTGDVIQADCSCAGTFADTDNDGVCDANDICNGGPEPGTSCDDGDPCTTGDVVQADCSCAGVFQDADNDGTCDANDLCNGGPEPGTSCDDGDPCTTGDVIQADCSCAGVFQDADNDGVCDANDLCNGGPEPGTVCDDGDPTTTGETIQEDCSCGGGVQTFLSCSSINSSNNDAEEKQAGNVNTASTDLELVLDGSNQTVGLRFVNLNIPQGATITSAYIQFTVDRTNNLNPCNLTLYGEASDNPAFFTSSNSNITNRLRTVSTVSWSPPDWQTVGEAGPAQQSTDIAPILQEIVDRSGYTANSSIVIIIDGIGRRTARSFNGNPAQAPELCVEYETNSAAPTASLPGDRGFSGALEELEESKAMPAITIYPNPTRGNLTLSFLADRQDRIPMQIRDVRGQVKYQTIILSKEGRNEVMLQDLDLPNGLYYLQMYLNGTRQTAKFIKMN